MEGFVACWGRAKALVTHRTLLRGYPLTPLACLQGNRFLWGYEESMDPELQEVFNLVVKSGINVFDTADSYGTGKLNGKQHWVCASNCQCLGCYFRRVFTYIM